MAFELILIERGPYQGEDGEISEQCYVAHNKWVEKKNRILKKVIQECKRDKLKMVGSELYQPWPSYPESIKYVFK